MNKLHALIALAALSGCASYSRVASTDVSPRTELRVRFDSARALVFSATGGDTLAIDDVVELQGLLIAMKDDSIRLGVKSAGRGARGRQRFGPGTTTTFALSGAQLDRTVTHTGRTIFLVVSLVGGLALMIAMATYQDPPPPPPPEPKPKA